MLIETTSRERMEHDLALYLAITTDELYEYIDYAAEKASGDWVFNTDIFEQEIASIVSDLQPSEHIDSIMCFHLSRRLNSSLDDLNSYNLKDWLLTDNSMVRFLNNHHVFFKAHNNHIAVYYHGHEVMLENRMDSDVCYLRNRFGYNCGQKDFCFNAFAMRDLLMKNTYTRALYDGPEFLIALSHYLQNRTILEDFIKDSTYFCYTLKIPLDEVIFDKSDKLNNEQKERYLIAQICYRLLMYIEERVSLFDDDNPIIRVADNVTLPASYVINSEIITLEMMD